MDTNLPVKQSSPLAMASEFIKTDSNVDVDKLAKLLEVQERWEANEARKAYVEAMAAFKADPPKIIKDKHVKYKTSKGDMDYHHASLENVTDTISKALSKHGLTASWVPAQADGVVTVTCRITHILGHYEEATLTSAPDSSGGKNPIQAIGSAVSYLQRYTVLALVGLATEGLDDDGARTSADKELPENVIDSLDKLRVMLEENTDGQPVSMGKLQNLLWTRFKKYPQNEDEARKTANWLVEKDMLNALKESA